MELSQSEKVVIRLRSGVLTKAMQQILVDSGKALTVELEDSNKNVYFIWNFPPLKSALDDIPLKIERTTSFASSIAESIQNKSQFVLLANQNSLPDGTKIIFKNTGGFIKGDKIELLSFEEKTKKLTSTKIAPSISNDQQFLALNISKGGIYVIANNSADININENVAIYLIFGIVLVVLLLGVWGAYLIILIKNKNRKGNV